MGEGVLFVVWDQSLGKYSRREAVKPKIGSSPTTAECCSTLNGKGYAVCVLLHSERVWVLPDVRRMTAKARQAETRIIVACTQQKRDSFSIQGKKT